MEKPFVSIVIPAFNSALTLPQTVNACLGQDYPKNRMEIIVVDDGSCDNTKDIVAGFDVIYLYQKKSGPASARNKGWKAAKGDMVCFTDADCAPEPDWVSKLADYCSLDKIGAVAGSYNVHGSPYILDKFIHYEIRDRHSRMPEYISSFGTYNVIIKKPVLELTGGFDPEYFNASGEDTDLSYRIIKAGYKIYFARDAFVSHRNVSRLWKYFIVQFRHGYWRMKLYRENIPMVIKDEYGYWKDFSEVLLGIIFAGSLFFDFKYRGALIAALFIIQVPTAVKIAFEGKNALYVIFSFFSFIRVFIRLTGGVLGFIKFWVFRMG